MSHESNDLRLFVAIYPPEDARRALLREVRKLSPPKHRETPLDQVHMTLQFIGETPRRDLDSVQESFERSAAGLPGFTLTPTRLITLPHRGHPRLIAAETDSPPALLEMQRRLVSRLARNPRASKSDRFTPHLTLCRFTGSAHATPVDHPLGAPPFPVDHIRLVRSILWQEGAVHTEVSRATLGA